MPKKLTFYEKDNPRLLINHNPDLFNEIHPTKNEGYEHFYLTLLKATTRKIWWLGKCGHEWETSVLIRTYGGSCPYCAGRKVLKGFNDLASVRPDLASEWHPTKNGDLQPSDMTYGSNLKVWWRCHHGHEWGTKIAKRTQPFGTGCPTCTNRIVLKGFNDLATTHPELANEWHPTKNGDLQPTDVSFGANKKVWWQCPRCGHEWQKTLNARTSTGQIHLHCKQ